MESETELLKLAMLAYEAAAEPNLWPDFLKRYTEVVGADFSVLQVHDLRQNESQVLSGFGLSDRFVQSYNKYYSRLNIWRERGRNLYIAGNVNLDHEYCPRPVFEHSEFYNDYMRLVGGHYSMAAIIRREEYLAPTLSSQRGLAKGSFTQEERQVASFLLPHLSRAWEVVKHWNLSAAGETVLDTLRIGVVFLGAGGQVLYCNRAAEGIFRANDGLTIRNGKLSAEDRLASSRLRKLVDDALAPIRTPGRGVVAVPRKPSTESRRGAAGACAQFQGDYQVAAAPVRATFRQFQYATRPMAVVFITDPERRQPADVELLIHAFQLTRKEAMLAAMLSTGKSVEQAAAELSITYQTARTHLRRIFSKTGAARQAELLLLIDRLPAFPDDHLPTEDPHG